MLYEVKEHAVDIILVPNREKHKQNHRRKNIKLKASDTSCKEDGTTVPCLLDYQQEGCSASSIPATGFLFFNTGVIS
jgi:hypothetical protein